MYQDKGPVSPRGVGSIAGSRSGRRGSFTKPKKVEPTRKAAKNFRIGVFFFLLAWARGGAYLQRGLPARQFLMGPSFCSWYASGLTLLSTEIVNIII